MANSPTPGRVRIIGGRWRGRRVRVADAEGLRPTPDRVRETLFNWLAPRLAGARVLDLFAGSGALALEALSRGAGAATLVESNPEVAARLRDAARELQAESLEVVLADAMAFVRGAGRGPFDVVFVDPPYAFEDYGKLCEALESGNLLRPDALVYVEFSARRRGGLQAPEPWRRHRAGRAGEVRFELWRRGGDIRGEDPPGGRPTTD